LTIELTPRRQPNRFGPAQEITYISASEIGLLRSRAQFPYLLKTLFLLEHLPEPVTCTGSHVLGLVFKRTQNLHATYAPHDA